MYEGRALAALSSLIPTGNRHGKAHMTTWTKYVVPAAVKVELPQQPWRSSASCQSLRPQPIAYSK